MQENTIFLRNETVYKCKWGLCQEVFSTNRQLWAHVETHIVDVQTRVVVIRQPEGTYQVLSLSSASKSKENIISDNINNEFSSTTMTANIIDANSDNSKSKPTSTSQSTSRGRKLKYATEPTPQVSMASSFQTSTPSPLSDPEVILPVPVPSQCSMQSSKVSQTQQSQEPVQNLPISQSQRSIQQTQTSDVRHPQQSILQSQMPAMSHQQQQPIPPIRMSESIQLQSQMLGILQPQTSGNSYFQQSVSQIQLSRLLQLQSRKSMESQVFVSTQQIIPTQPAVQMQKLMETEMQALALQNLMNNQINSPNVINVITPANDTSTIINCQQILRDVNNSNTFFLPMLNSRNNGNQINLSTTSSRTTSQSAPPRTYTPRSPGPYRPRSQLSYPSIRPVDPQNTQGIQMPVQHNNGTTPMTDNLNSIHRG
ncbi:2225_t:CDS:2 [Ambispora leptoticha]|uniref:2225_t:CDS:1 n=1 Tax=Ambispora leptoticha TaxID=144679 RepID=A0A9N8YU65_9GLOM|nr:2225_t:CDS:2 [Ambispora leptoticha]